MSGEKEDVAPTDEELRGQPPAEEPAEKPAEQPAEADDQQEPETDKNGMVPHGALHEERQRRKEAEERTRALESQFQTADQRLQQLMEWKQQQEEAEKAWLEPQWDENDPQAQVGYLKKQVEDLRGDANNYFKQQQQEREQQQLASAYQQAHQQFSSQTPDADQALQHLWDLKRQEYQLYGIPPQHVEQAVNREFQNIVMAAFSQGRNPVEAMYQAAQKAGYSPQQAQQMAESAEQQIDRLDQGQRASKSLSQTGGKPAGNLSMKKLGEMSDEEFANLSESEFRAAMGG